MPNAAENGATLRASRRLDWRFLLPDPALDAAAYIGPATGSLLPALRAFSRSVDNLGQHGASAGSVRYDVVVLERAPARMLGAAKAILKPDGWLYAEVVKQSPLDLASAFTYAEAIHRAGFQDVALHWHWPTFEACTRIVPLDDPTPFVQLLMRGRTDARARTLAVLARGLIGTGAMARLARCFSVVGRAA